MTYERVSTKGRLIEIGRPTLQDRMNCKKMISPEKLYLTSIVIETGNKGQASIDIYGEVIPEYLRKEVEVVQSCYLAGDRKIFIQEFYVNGIRRINETIVKEI